MEVERKTEIYQERNRKDDEEWTSDTVFLEPFDLEKSTKQHPVCIGKALKSVGVQNYTSISAVGKFRFKVTFQSAHEAKKLVEVNLKEENLKCYMPVTLKQTVGLIKGIPKSYTEEELRENLETDVTILKVERMRTMDSNRNLKDTENVKIVCKGKDLPANVELYGCFFKVELYLFPI